MSVKIINPARMAFIGVLQARMGAKPIREYRLGEIAALSSAQSLILAEQLFDEAEAEYMTMSERARRLLSPEITREERKDLWRWSEQRLSWFDGVESVLREGMVREHDLLMRDYASSYKQLLHIAANMCAPGLSIEAIGKILSIPPVSTKLIDGKGFRIGVARGEIAFMVMFGLRAFASSYEWIDQSLLLTLPHERVQSSKRMEVLELLVWPPVPEDPLLRALQRILGWQFNIQPSDDHTNFTIDFGDTYIESQSG